MSRQSVAMIGEKQGNLQSEQISSFGMAGHEDMLRLEAEVTAEVLDEVVDETAEEVSFAFLGRAIRARPIDTRRFVQAMARHICFN